MSTYDGASNFRLVSCSASHPTRVCTRSGPLRSCVNLRTPFRSGTSLHILPFAAAAVVWPALWWQHLALSFTLSQRPSRAEPCSGVLRPCPTSPFALGSNASSFAVEAISAPPASSMLAVPVGSGIPFHSDALKPGDSTSLALTFMTVHVGTKQTRALGLHRRNR